MADLCWDDARRYALWSGKRLPTAVEWLRAAAGLEGRAYPYGTAWREGVGNVATLAAVPVGTSGDATPEGVLDLTGNVFEWTASREDGRVILAGSAYEWLPGSGRALDLHVVEPQMTSPAVGFRCVWP